MNRNDSPRLTIKLYEIFREILQNKSLLSNFSIEFLDGLVIDDENFVQSLLINFSLNYIQNLNVAIIDNKYYFKGYPTGNHGKIFCKILELWHNHGSFPINFFKLEGLKDQTPDIVDSLNCQTAGVNFIFNFIKENSKTIIFNNFIY